MGRAAAEVLLERIGNPLVEPRRIYFDPEMVVRGSA